MLAASKDIGKEIESVQRLEVQREKGNLPKVVEVVFFRELVLRQL
jgi:hypothetical protein